MEKKARSVFTAVGLKMGEIAGFINCHVILYEYWLKRISAVAVDFFILLIATGLILPNAHFLEFVLASGGLSLVYFSLMETRFGYSIGKKVFSLNVVNSKNKKPTLKTSLIRNITKFNIILLLADIIIGLKPKSHQKYVDKIANITVVETSITEQKPISKVIYYEEPTKIS